jgi:hypothetical protein
MLSNEEGKEPILERGAEETDSHLTNRTRADGKSLRPPVFW